MVVTPPLNGGEAISLFGVIIQKIWEFLFSEDVKPCFPNPARFAAVRNAEWQRTRRTTIDNTADYWQEYLLGEAGNRISYDILNVSDEYTAFLDEQIHLLDMQPGCRVADMGCGTGNLAQRFLSQGSESASEAAPPRIFPLSISCQTRSLWPSGK